MEMRGNDEGDDVRERRINIGVVGGGCVWV